MAIECCNLTSCSVAPDGSRVSLGMIDADGRETILSLALKDVGSLLMTLPTLVEAALRRKHDDPTLRYVHPIGDWRVESTAEEQTFIVTLSTKEGFAVSFALPRRICDALAGDLRAIDAAAPAPLRH